MQFGRKTVFFTYFMVANLPCLQWLQTAFRHRIKQQSAKSWQKKLFVTFDATFGHFPKFVHRCKSGFEAESCFGDIRKFNPDKNGVHFFHAYNLSLAHGL